MSSIFSILFSISFVLIGVAIILINIFGNKSQYKKKRIKRYLNKLNRTALYQSLIFITTTIILIGDSSEKYIMVALCCSSLCYLQFVAVIAYRLSIVTIKEKFFNIIQISAIILFPTLILLPVLANLFIIIIGTAALAIICYAFIISHDYLINLKAKEQIIEFIVVLFITMLLIALHGLWLSYIPTIIIAILANSKPSRIFGRDNSTIVRTYTLPSLEKITLEDSTENNNKEAMKERLLDYLESTKEYLNPDIRITDVANKIYTNKSYLSNVIHSKLDKNFIQLIHYYRIKEAINIFSQDPSITMAQLCEKSGFNSMSSFSSAFKIHTGSTPAEWCKSYKRKMIKDVIRDS